MLAINSGRRPIKILATITLITIVTLAGCLYYSATQKPIVQSQNIAQPETQQAQVATTTSVVDYTSPERIKIPSINVDAPVDQMGLAPNGDMESPTGASNTGWYKLGPHPGDKGTAVIAGHYGPWKDGSASVFDNLNKLAAGDQILVQDANGTTATFAVRESKMLGKNDDATAVFKTTDDKSHLNLITCQGTWSEDQKTYSDRLVVFADKIDE